jgi:hypothetical protein
VTARRCDWHSTRPTGRSRRAVRGRPDGPASAPPPCPRYHPDPTAATAPAGQPGSDHPARTRPARGGSPAVTQVTAAGDPISTVEGMVRPRPLARNSRPTAAKWDASAGQPVHRVGGQHHQLATAHRRSSCGQSRRTFRRSAVIPPKHSRLHSIAPHPIPNPIQDSGQS